MFMRANSRSLDMDIISGVSLEKDGGREEDIYIFSLLVR